MTSVTKNQPKLTRNQSLVLETLVKANVPMSAYSILDQLRADGFKAPLQVYRALEHLINLEKVHRLESLNAFVACCHPHVNTHETTAFTICEDCGQVSELSSKKLDSQIATVTDDCGFAANKTTIELRGLCRQCQAA